MAVSLGYSGNVADRLQYEREVVSVVLIDWDVV